MQDQTNNKTYLNKLVTRFQKYFDEVDDFVSYAKAADRLSMFIFLNNKKLKEEYLNKFVQEYCNMKNNILYSRDKMLETLNSKEFKEAKWFNRIQLKTKLNKYNKWCNLLNKFEEDFYDRTGISLLRVKNERWAKEQSEKRTQSIQQ